MADENTKELHRAKRGVAILAACIVETLNETDHSFKERFLAKLGEGHADRAARLGHRRATIQFLAASLPPGSAESWWDAGQIDQARGRAEMRQF